MTPIRHWRGFWRGLAPTVRDRVLAAAVALAVFGALLLAGTSAPVPVTAGLAVGVAAPLVLRRRLPLTAAVLAAAVALPGWAAVQLLGGWVVPAWPGLLVAMGAFCSAVYHRPRRPAFAVAAAVGWFAAYLMTAGASRAVFVAAVVVSGLVPLIAGYTLRLHRERAAQALRVQRAEAGRAVAEERASIAREVHDAVGHHLTAIRMQANASRHVHGESPPLGTIADLASSALGEVRALLETLRDNETECAGTVLADVPALADRLSTPECPIVVERCGELDGLPALVDHGGYRLVQEALTNAVRHAGASEIRVRIARERESVSIVVEDDGPTAPPDGIPAEGHGIRGMVERVRLLGGRLRFEARRPHGWLVRVTLPIRRAVA